MSVLSRILPLTLFAVLAACGGDSGDLRMMPAGDAGDAGADVQGRAVKGVLQGAQVELMVPAGDSLVVVDSTVTDDAGVFSFVDLPQGPFKVVVSAPLDGSGRMLCDAASGCGESNDGRFDINGNGQIDFGESTPLAANFSLTAWFAEAPGQGALAVTPLTHMAAVLAESYPGSVDARAVSIAQATVASLFGLPADFASRWPVAVTESGELDGAGAADIQHALLAAGFAELATLGEMQAVLDAYASSLVEYGGQLPLEGGTADLQALVDASVVMAQTLLAEGASLSQTLAGLQALVQRWSGSHTAVSVSAPYSEADMSRARVVLDDLDHYLGLADINAQGRFFSTQVGQLDWLYTEATLDFAGVVMESAGEVIMVALMGDLIAERYGVTELDLSSGTNTVIFNTSTRELSITRNGLAETVAITVQVDELVAGAQAGELAYSMDGLVANATVSGTLQGALGINLYDTDLMPVINAAHQLMLENPDYSEQDLVDALLDLVRTFHGRATVAGDMALFKTEDPTFAFTVEGSAWGEINVPAIDAGGDVVAVEVSHGSITSPWGDSLYSLEGQSPALRFGLAEDAVLDTVFGFEAFGMPAMEVAASGRLERIGVLLLEVINGLDLSAGSDQLLALISGLDFSVLDLHGSATLAIPDDGKQYQFTLDGLRLAASLPNSVEQGLVFHLASVNGGYLYAGDSLIGSVTFDWANTGASLFLHDGTVRHYFLGPIDDLLPAELVAALQGAAG